MLVGRWSLERESGKRNGQSTNELLHRHDFSVILDCDIFTSRYSQAVYLYELIRCILRLLIQLPKEQVVARFEGGAHDQSANIL